MDFDFNIGQLNDTLTIRINTTLKDRLKGVAKDNGVSLSRLIQVSLDHLYPDPPAKVYKDDDGWSNADCYWADSYKRPNFTAYDQ